MVKKEWKKNLKPKPPAIKFSSFFQPPWLLVFDILSKSHAIPHTPSIWGLRVDYFVLNGTCLFAWLTHVTILSQKQLHNSFTKPYISDCLHCLLLTNRFSVNPAKPGNTSIEKHYFSFNLLTFLLIFLSPNSISLSMRYFTQVALREKCPNTDIFLVRIFPHSDWIRRDTPYLSVFSPNVGKYRPEKTPYLDTFHAV